MVTPDTGPDCVIAGPNCTALRLHGSFIDDGDPPLWTEAWQLRASDESPASIHRILGRLYLVRIEEPDTGRQVIALIGVDDLMVADARKAGLPTTLGHDGQIVCVCPETVTPPQGRWVLRMLARKAVRDLPVPIRTAGDRALWRHAADVLIDVLTVNPALTASL